MTTAPSAPWSVSGESLVGLVARPPAAPPLPAELSPMPGPTVVAATCFTDTAVGPYVELTVAVPARLGARVGWCVTTMVVDSAASRFGGRANWGYPKELGSLVWQVDGDERCLRWAERGLEVRGRVIGLPLPFLVPVRTLQRRVDGPLVVPARVRGLGRLTRVDVTVPADDPLAPLAGRHAGVHVAGLRGTVRPAREPSGVVAALRAPLRAPVGALLLADDEHGRLAQR